MKELVDILGDPSFSGVYILQTASTSTDLGKLVADRGLEVFPVNGKNVRTKERFLTVLAEALQFPDYFGFNWDALEDCLTDLSWFAAEGFVIAYDYFGVLARHDPDEADTALDILVDSAEYWRNQGKFFVVLLDETGGSERDLPVVRY